MSSEQAVPERENDALLVPENEYSQQIESDLAQAKTEILLRNEQAEIDRKGREVRLESWHKAEGLVKEFRPVPWIIWRVIRSVYGESEGFTEVSPSAFSVIDRLMFQAVTDRVLGRYVPPSVNKQQVNIEDSVNLIGVDVAAALCLIHGVCRRVVSALAERVWRAILDDALLRATIGYYVGELSEEFGHGKGMLAGFSGRSGLAIQLAYGSLNQAQRTLEELAHGQNIREVGLQVYGCEPLQVSALALTASGCHRDAAFGTVSFALERDDLEPESEQFRWLSAFSITELLRMGKSAEIDDRYWNALGFESEDQRKAITQQSRLLQRRGHSFGWLTWPQLAMDRQN